MKRLSKLLRSVVERQNLDSDNEKSYHFFTEINIEFISY